MKKYSIAFIAIFAIITCAFALKPSKQSAVKEGSNKQVSLYWFIPATGGGQATYTGRQNTHTDEVSPSGCSDIGNVHCEDGYDGNDFNTVNDPYSGLKSGATLNDFIRKQ